MTDPITTFSIGKPQRPPPPPPMGEPPANLERHEHHHPDHAAPKWDNHDQLPVIFWITVHNAPMPTPVTIKILCCPDARLCLTLQQADTAVSAVLQREDLGDLYEMLTDAIQTTV